MCYISGYTAEKEKERAYDIHYWVIRQGKNLFIQALAEGTSIEEIFVLKSNNLEKAEKTAALLAKRAVHPWHLKDILSDLDL